jgi:hypothetical protein
METMTNSLESQFSFGFFGVNEVVEVNKILANEKEEASHAHEGIVITKEQIFSIEPQKLNLDNGIPVVPYRRNLKFLVYFSFESENKKYIFLS